MNTETLLAFHFFLLSISIAAGIVYLNWRSIEARKMSPWWISLSLIPAIGTIIASMGLMSIAAYWIALTAALPIWFLIVAPSQMALGQILLWILYARISVTSRKSREGLGSFEDNPHAVMASAYAVMWIIGFIVLVMNFNDITIT